MSERVDGESTEPARIDRDIRWLFALGGVVTATVLPFYTPLLQSWGLSPSGSDSSCRRWRWAR